MTVNTLAFSLFSRCSHHSAFGHDRRLVNWLRIKFCDVDAGQSLLTLLPARSFLFSFSFFHLFSFFISYFSSCENGFKLKQLQDITHKRDFISKLIVITVTREICLWIHYLFSLLVSCFVCGFVLFALTQRISSLIFVTLISILNIHTVCFWSCRVHS